jgi:hypothetical protein
MTHWIAVKGIVKAGYGVASGRAGDPRFLEGTIALQKPFFKARGLDLDGYFAGTINVAISPHRYVIRQAKHTFRSVKWSPTEPAEDFSFFDCRILWADHPPQLGLIYYPHPETKPEHFQAPDVLEIMTGWMGGLKAGNEIVVECDSHQIEFI